MPVAQDAVTVTPSAIFTRDLRFAPAMTRLAGALRRNARIGVFLMGTASIVAVAWLVLIVSRARAGEGLDAVTRVVVAVDGVVVLPLMCFGGLWLWRQQPLGHVLTAVLLVKSVATFLTLAVASLVAWTAGGRLVALELTAYGAGLVIAALLLFNCLARLEDTSVIGRPSS
jgi:hypothetical protein